MPVTKIKKSLVDVFHGNSLAKLLIYSNYLKSGKEDPRKSRVPKIKFTDSNKLFVIVLTRKKGVPSSVHLF